MGHTCEGMWHELKHCILTSKNNHIPKREHPNTGRKKTSWFNQETKSAVKHKSKTFNKWLKTRKQTDYKLYRRASNKCRQVCNAAKKGYEAEVAREAKANPKKFWSYINTKLKTKSGMSDLNREDGTKTSDDNEKSEILNKYFCSVFTNENLTQMPTIPNYHTNSQLCNITFTVEEVLGHLNNLNINKSCGPDELHPRVLKELASVIAEPLSNIFNSSMNSGTLPSDWKLANISPVFKKGNKCEVKNYRPISLTSIICKIMEKIIKDKIVKHLTNNKIISPNQHGFLQGRSCITNLLEMLDECTALLDTGECVDVLYTDFQKAFDSVPHSRLLCKCKAVGIQGKLLAWIKAFLTGRSQRVVVNGCSSDYMPVASGVPQGSVLGPLLFLIYINDLPDVIQNVSKLFADDAKVLSASSKNVSLQDDINNITDWCNKWQLYLNTEKCSVLHIGKTSYSNNYTITCQNVSTILKTSHLEKDLGILIDNKLKFDQHITSIVGKANRMVGLIRRSFDFLDAHSFQLLFKAMVRPILEYGQVVWSPHQKYLIGELEGVQRRATKMIPGSKNLEYGTRLKWLNLQSLENRRKRGDLIETYKYLNGLYSTERNFFELNKNSITRGHHLKIKHQYSRLDNRKYFFANRVVEDWNNLPAHVVKADSVNCFKNRLDKHWLSNNLWFDSNTVI